MKIDAETHIISPALARPGRMKGRRKSFFREKIYLHPEGKSALKQATVEKILESMAASGIDRSVIMGLPFEDGRSNDEVNRYVRMACRKHPSRFFGAGILDPFGNFRDEIRAFRNDCGFIGVKVIPAWQGFALDDKRFYRVAEEIVRNGMILLPHIDYMISEDDKGGPGRLFNLIRKFPELKVMAPHLGGLLCFHYLHEPAKRFFENVRFITSVSETMRLVRYASEVLDEDKLVFGTDYPFQPCHDQKTIVERFEKLGIAPALMKKIYSQNLLDFLNV